MLDYRAMVGSIHRCSSNLRLASRGIHFVVNLLLFTVISHGQVLTGVLSTTENDYDKPIRVIAKRGNLVAMDSTFLLGETYTADWSTVGVDRFDYQLPRPKLLGIANSVSSDGNIYALVSGNLNEVFYRVYDIQGREIQRKSNLPAGKYFLQLLNISNGELLGVHSFVLLNHQLNVEIKSSVSETQLLKPAEDSDSLIVIYEADDMEIESYREAVVVPANGYTQFDIELVRNRRGPLIYFSNVPESPTIDTTYIITIDAFSPDYDDQVTEIDVFHLLGDSIQYEFNGIDSLLISPHTQGDHEFHVLVNTLFSHRGRNIELDIQSQSYNIVLTKLFHGLGLPRSGLDVSLLGKAVRTGVDGLATFEFPTTTILDEEDSLDIDDNILGNLQNDTGPFAAMRVAVNPELVNAGVTDTLQTFTDVMMIEDSTYWDAYVWANQLDREFYLLGAIFNPDFVIPRWGSPETGFTDMLHYTPEHYYNGSQGIVDFRVEAQTVIDTISTMITQLSEGGQVPFNIVSIAPEDSMQAIILGNTFDFTHQHSYLIYIDYTLDDETGIAYIDRAGEAIDKTVSSHAQVRMLMAHELGRGFGYNGFTPYDPQHPDYLSDILGSGDLQPHDFYGYFFAMNADPKLFQHIRNLPTILPNSYD